MICIAIYIYFFFSYLEVLLQELSVPLVAFGFPVIGTCIFAESHFATGLMSLCFAFLLEIAKSRLVEIC